MSMTQRNLDRLGHDLKRVVGDLEDLLGGIPEDLGEEAVAARKRIANSLDSARDICHRLQRQARAGATATDEFVHENAWPFIGAAVGIGLLLGALCHRKRPCL